MPIWAPGHHLVNSLSAHLKDFATCLRALSHAAPFHPLQVVTSSFSWEYSCFTVLCYFLGYNQVNQLCVYIHCISLRSE